MTSFNKRCWWLPLLLVGACSREAVAPRGEGGGFPQPRIVLESSDPEARAGARITVRVGASLDGSAPFVDLSGVVHFDPHRLRYLGQPLSGQSLIVVNADRRNEGTLRVVAYDPHGLGAAPIELAFDVLATDAVGSVSFEFGLGGTAAPVWYRQASPATGVAPLESPPSAAPPKLLTTADWAGQLAWGKSPRRGPALTPGQGTIYGDVTLDGAVDLFDILFVANLTVGLQPLLTDLNKDYVIAGDVAPFNLPGLGEAGDSLPPGLNADGTHTIDLFDLLPIGNEVAGVDQPIVGEPIPGRQAATTRVVLSGVLPLSRTLTADTIYELHGIVDVPGGVRLTIEAGTRIEGDGASRGALVVRRGGRLFARGTRLQPIVFTCTGARTRGCWGGVVLNGFSLLNNGLPGSGGVDVQGCPERASIGNSGVYGGCLVQDTSGVLRYVRIEYAGMAPPGGGPAPGLALLGTGSGTALDSVQVRESLGDGLFISGGTVDLRSVVLTDNLGAGLAWNDGWVGRGQSLIIQQGSDGREAIRGSDADADFTARPLSAPRLYNVTIIGPPTAGMEAAPGILLGQGSGGTIRNAVILKPTGAGLEIDGTESCALATGAAPSIQVDHAIFFAGSPDLSGDSDCIDEVAYGMDPARANRFIDPGLLGPLVSQSPDLRPESAGAAATGAVAPPSDGFFDVTQLWIGGVTPADASRAGIPWYSGWTVGWP